MGSLLANLRTAAGQAARDAGMRKRAGSDAQILRRLPGGRALVRLGTGQERTLRYFFILGFGKSGTNWVGSLFNLHHTVQSEGEYNLHGFDDALARFTGEGGGRLGGVEPYRSIAQDEVKRLYERVLTAMLDQKPQATHLGDRTPRPLQQILPGAPIIWVTRDPRDVIVSYTYHYLRLNPAASEVIWPDRVRELFAPFAAQYNTNPPESCFETASALLRQEQWVGFVANRWAVQTEADLAAYEHLKTSEPILRVRYEDLHLDTEAGRRAMYEHIGVDPADAEPIASTSGTAPGFSREDPTSFYRKGAVGDWAKYDTPVFRKKFEQQAGEVARKAGYGDWIIAA